MTGEDYAKIIDAMNKSKMEVLLIIGFVLLMVFIGFTLKWYFQIRKDASLEISKQRRADEYRTTMGEFAGKLETMLGSIGYTLNKVDSTLKLCTERLDAKVNFADSLKIVNDRFNNVISREICIIFERSLTLNDYEKRKEFISRKVRTQIGELLTNSRTWLADIKMAFDTDRFFTMETSAGPERFILCDRLWTAVEPMFLRKDLELDKRVEEACFIIANVVSDYINPISLSCVDSTTGSSGSQGTDFKPKGKGSFGNLKESNSSIDLKGLHRKP